MLLTIDFLNPLQIILWEFKVMCFHILVERSHDSTGVIGVFQAQGMTQLMDSNQKEIIPYRENTQAD